MRLVDYYRFEKVETITKTTMRCVASTKSYDTWERQRKMKSIKATKQHGAINEGDLLIRLTRTDYINARPERKTDLALLMGDAHVTSIYRPDPNSDFGFGDIRNSKDAIITKFCDLSIVNGAIGMDSIIEIFIARGKGGKDGIRLWEMACNGELDDEFDKLRSKAISEGNKVCTTPLTLC